ncbi:oxygen-dependent protoporphyrinogen oxidase [Knufia obscura]|uniref:protoporphyrinogen oxidase n=1 Tax=Knufia obscura TaxID=1635080 RepID=A0ABR0S130_9EURO|nr:oxygen-dependent protoporphyrinogen oxidase [Knufia obscura]
MHLACRYGSSHNAVKLVLPRAWQINIRSFSTTPLRLARGYKHDPDSVPDGLLGSYIPNANPNPRAKNIAVIGGGVSGLATAFNLTQDIPNAKITIYEKKEKLGGWVDSEQVEVDDGSVLFEWGPRTLRPDLQGNGMATLQLINRLGKDLTDSMRGVPLGHPAATNRYIYYPDHLVRMPGPNPNTGVLSKMFDLGRTVLSEPAFKGIVPALLAEPTIACRPDNVRDESVGSFMKRRFGPALTDNLLSGLFHGIYAGDIYKLSARQLMPFAWYLENRDKDGNGVIAEMLELVFRAFRVSAFDRHRFRSRFVKDDVGPVDEFNDIHQAMAQCSVYTFVKGVGQLTDALLENLRNNANVTINTGVELSSKYDSSHKRFAITTQKNDKPKAFDYAICTTSPHALHAMIKPENTQAKLKSALTRDGQGFPSVNVMVVNLYYSSPDLDIPRGFGYLIPRSVPAEQNPERALGVIFSSETAGPRGQEAFQEVSRPTDEMLRLEKMKKRADEFTERISHFRNKSEAAKERQKRAEEELEKTRAVHASTLKLLMEKDAAFKHEKVQLGQDTASGTKLAVMIGGHWWDGWAESDLPSEEEAIEMAKSVIGRHLGVTEQPMVAKARLQRDCIPQYQVGYRDDMASIHKELVKEFDGRLKVGGVWWQGGVGVNDCVKGAREMSRRIREGWDEQTGLEDYAEPEKWVLRDNRTGSEVMDPMQQ